MRKRAIICLAALCTVLMTGCGGRDSGTVPENDGTSVTIDAAKKIALKKAGLNEKDGKWKKEKKDRDNGRIVYELEFVSGKMEYEFEIDAKSGEVLEYDKDSVYD